MSTSTPSSHRELHVTGISKSFGAKQAVNNLSFSVGAGEAFVILGPNGAGKTTTFNMLLGLEQADDGEAKFGELNLWSDRNQVRDHLFYLPENVSLYPELSGIENIQYFSQLAGKQFAEQEILKQLNELGITDEAAIRPSRSYSKGMRQKTALALAKLKRAKLILLDEPTSGLDPYATGEFINLVNQFKDENAVIVMITHDLHCAWQLASQIGVLSGGKLQSLLQKSQTTLESLEQHYFKAIA